MEYFSSCSAKTAFISGGQHQPNGTMTDSSVISYLSHSCLQDLEPCLCFQFRLHQPCREDEGQIFSSPHGLHPMPCNAPWQAGPIWSGSGNIPESGNISRRASATGLGLYNQGWGQEVFTGLLGHIGQRQVLFIVPDAEGKGWSHDTAK